MAIHLSSRKIAQLQAASTILLSPFSYENGDEWRRAVCGAFEPLVEACGSMVGLEFPDEGLLIGDRELVTALGSVMPPTGWLREAYIKYHRVFGLSVVDWLDIFDPSAVRRTDFYHDIVRPNRLYAPLMLTAEVGGSPLGAAVFNYFDHEGKAASRVAERKATLQILAPAFQAGVDAYVSMKREREKLISFGELSGVALMLLDLRGRTLYQSRAFEQLVARDPDESRIRAEAARVAANLSTTISSKNPLAHADHPIKTRLATRAGSYGISALSFGDRFGHATLIGVLISDESAPRLDADRLRSEFHLTKRELQTAALLQRRMPAKQIAATLGVSVNTARRHTEHVLAKLGVHSKQAAAEQLNGN